MSWEQAWQEGRTGWDAGEAAPALVELAESGELPAGRALVPGCGSGYDAFALASPEREVLGLDLAPTAAQRFRALREERGLDPARVDVVLGDFFEDAWRPDARPFDLIWDYTFLCALDPARHGDWADRMGELVRPGGVLLTLLFPVLPEEEAEAWRPGPPWPLDPEEIRALLEARFELARFDVSPPGHGPRRGKERLALWRRR